MMRIVSLAREKKHLTRLAFEDGGDCLLDNDTCSENALRTGGELTGERLAELKYDSEYRRAKSRALWYLDRGDHTEKALYGKLIKAGFDKRASAAVIARLAELGVVNDRRFAENFAERCRESNISRRETMRKLLEKGVPYELAKELLNETEIDEEAQIRALIQKKYAGRLAEEKGPERVYAALIRRGFSFGAVRSVLKKYSEELEFSEE